MLNLVLFVAAVGFLMLYLAERDLARRWEKVAKEAIAVAEDAVSHRRLLAVMVPGVRAQVRKEWKQ